MVLKIDRTQDARSLMSQVSDVVGTRPHDRLIRGFARRLEERGRQVWSGIGIEQSPAPHQSGEPCYVTAQPLAKLVATTVMAAVVRSPLAGTMTKNRPGHSTWDDDPYDSRTRALTLQARGSEPAHDQLQSTGGQNRFLSIATTVDTPPFTVGWRGKGASKSLVYWREFYPESLAPLAGCTASVQVTRQAPERRQVIPFGPIAHLGDLLTQQMLEERNASYLRLTVEYRVPRNEVCGLVARVAEAVASMHVAGKIHGDLKPSNILVCEDGPRLIDSLDLAPGRLSPSASPGWAAPEQLAMEPVGAQVDVYALGLMLANLIGGTLTGMLATYVLPGGDEIQFIEKPYVFIPLDDGKTDPDSRERWLRFVDQCLERDPIRRPRDAGEFHARLSELMRSSPLRGDVDFSLPAFKQPVLLDLPGDGLRAGWVLNERRAVPAGEYVVDPVYDEPDFDVELLDDTNPGF